MNITETIDNLSSTATSMKNNFDKKIYPNPYQNNRSIWESEAACKQFDS